MADTEYRQGDTSGDVSDPTTRRRGDDRNQLNHQFFDEKGIRP